MSFNLYFAGCNSLDYGIKKFLFSQYNDRRTIEKLADTLINPEIKMFLDSGAWTAFTKGVTIDIDEYIEYINNNINLITCVASVDVIPSSLSLQSAKSAAEQSWENFIYMRHRVENSKILLPVFHQSENFQNLIRILEWEDDFGKIDYIGIGALASTKDITTREIFISKCFDIITNISPNIKVHGFGMTDLSLLERYPFYSADSTTWRMAAVMGEILTEFGRIIVSNRRKSDSKYDLSSKQNVEILSEYVSNFGFNLDELSNDAEARARFNVAYLLSWEKSYVCKYSATLKQKLF